MAVSILPIGSSLTDSILAEGELDNFTVSLVSGVTYRFAATSFTDGSGLPDPTLGVFDQDINLLAFDDDSGAGLNSEIIFEAPFTGDFLLAVTAFDSGDGVIQTGNYTVSAEEVDGTLPPVVDPPGLADVVLPLGSSLTDSILIEGELDNFSVALVGGVTYRFAVTGFTDGTGLADPTLGVFDQDINLLAFDDDSGAGLNSEIIFEAPFTGDFLLAVTAFDSGDGVIQTGNYTVSAEEVVATLPISVPVGSTTRDTIEFAGGEDVFTVSLDAGATYRFAATGTGDAGGLPDPTLTLTDAGGAQLAFDDDGGQGLNSEIVFTARSSGEFRLIVAGFDTSTGDYELVVQDRTGAEAPTGPADRSRGTLSDDVLFGGGSSDVIRGLAGDDAVSGRAGDDRLIGGQGRDTLRGGGGEDTVIGGGSNDRLLGNGADDQIRGGGGRDILVGGGGEDTLRGGGGNDRLTGGRGEDVMVGNAGADRFIFASGHGKNTISDFSQSSGDKIQILSGADSFSDLDFRVTDLGVIVSFGAAEVLVAGIGGPVVTPGGGRKDDNPGFSTGGLEADDFIF